MSYFENSIQSMMHQIHTPVSIQHKNIPKPHYALANKERFGLLDSHSGLAKDPVTLSCYIDMTFGLTESKFAEAFVRKPTSDPLMYMYQKKLTSVPKDLIKKSCETYAHSSRVRYDKACAATFSASQTSKRFQNISCGFSFTSCNIHASHTDSLVLILRLVYGNENKNISLKITFLGCVRSPFLKTLRSNLKCSDEVMGTKEFKLSALFLYRRAVRLNQKTC
jgi:hypothetical protein